MKKNLLLFIAFLFAFNSFAQYVYWNEFDGSQEGVNIEEFVRDNYIQEGCDIDDATQNNCHGYAWNISLENSIWNDCKLGFDLGDSFCQYIANLDQCSAEDATHIVYHTSTLPNNRIDPYKIAHSAIVSQFAAFPYKEGWVQSICGPSPNVVLHKVDFEQNPNVKIAYINYSNDFKSIDGQNEIPPLICNQFAGPIVFGEGSGVLTPIGLRYYYPTVDYCEGATYNWYSSTPSAALRFYQYPSTPNKCRVHTLISGWYTLKVDVSYNGTTTTYSKQVYLYAGGRQAMTTKSGKMELTLSFNEEENLDVSEVTLMSVSGQVIETKKLNGNEVSFNTSSLKPGIYIASVKNSMGAFNEKVLIK